MRIKQLQPAAALLIAALATAAWSQAAPTTAPATTPATAPANSTLVTGKLVIPAEVESFTDRTADLILYEYDPRLADAAAKQIDHVAIKPFKHEKGKETSVDFKIGAAGTIAPGRSYYVTAFILDGTTRTHIGENNARSGLANVITAGNPRELKSVFRPVRT